jgi:hypothetical protein
MGDYFLSDIGGKGDSLGNFVVERIFEVILRLDCMGYIIFHPKIINH